LKVEIQSILKNQPSNINFSVGQGDKDHKVTNQSYSYEEFKILLTSFSKRKIKADSPYFIGGHFSSNENGKVIRKTKHLQSRSLIVLDIDNYNGELNYLESDLNAELSQYWYIAYSTASHTPDTPKIRVVIFLTHDIPTDKYKAVATNFTKQLSFKAAIDDASLKPNQCMYLPIYTHDDYVPWHKINEAELLNPDDFNCDNTLDLPARSTTLALVHDATTRKTSSKFTTAQILNCLNQYDVHKTDYHSWINVGMALHYEYNGSDEGLKTWLDWSMNDTRYSQEQINNDITASWCGFKNDVANPITFATIFAIVKKTEPNVNIEEQVDVKARFHDEVMKMIEALTNRSAHSVVEDIISFVDKHCIRNEAEPYLRAIKAKTSWSIKDLRNIRYQENKKHVLEQFKSEQAKSPKAKIYPTTQRLPPYLFSDYIIEDCPKATYANFEILLKHYDIKVRYNIISKDNEVTTPKIQYSLANEANANYAEIFNVCKLNNIETSCIESYIYKVADLNQYNPIAEFIYSKPWDKQSRLNELYSTIETTHTYPIELKELLIQKWLISAVAAVLDKEFHSKGVLVFQGDQSLGKTPWLKKLLPSPIARYFGEGYLLDPANKDSVKTAISSWIVELGELDATFKKDIARLKAFITNQRDVLRNVYAHRNSNYPRTTVFCGSVNEKEFLVDSTGNVRFWVLPLVYINYEHTIDMQQVWAEVAELYRQKERWWLSPVEEKQLGKMNLGHVKTSPLEEILLKKFKTTVEEGDKVVKKNATELLQELGYALPSTPQLREMVQVLDKLGVERSSHDKKYKLVYKPINCSD